MASLVYNSALDDLAKGNIDFNSDTFKVMLMKSQYIPNKDTHSKRSDLTNEATGTNYVSGGKPTNVTITKDLTNDRLDIYIDRVYWEHSTISASGAVIYKARGGLASADELVAYVDFNNTINSINQKFTVEITSPLRFQN